MCTRRRKHSRCEHTSDWTTRVAQALSRARDMFTKVQIQVEESMADENQWCSCAQVATCSQAMRRFVLVSWLGPSNQTFRQGSHS